MPGFNPSNYTNTEQHDTADSGSTTLSTNIENTKLYMPSELSVLDRHKFCPNGLASMEDRIRFAEVSNSLENLRHHLCSISLTGPPTPPTCLSTPTHALPQPPPPVICMRRQY